MGAGRNGGRISEAPLKRALSFLYHRSHKPREKNPMDPKISRGKQLSSLLISCILVLNILFSNLNPFCCKNWSKSASDCYHYKKNYLLNDLMNTERKTTLYDWLNLPSQYPYKARERQTLSLFYQQTSKRTES